MSKNAVVKDRDKRNGHDLAVGIHRCRHTRFRIENLSEMRLARVEKGDPAVIPVRAIQIVPQLLETHLRKTQPGELLTRPRDGLPCPRRKVRLGTFPSATAPAPMQTPAVPGAGSGDIATALPQPAHAHEPAQAQRPLMYSIIAGVFKMDVRRGTNRHSAILAPPPAPIWEQRFLTMCDSRAANSPPPVFPAFCPRCAMGVSLRSACFPDPLSFSCFSCLSWAKFPQLRIPPSPEHLNPPPCPVPPCSHRAPPTLPTDPPRLLLIR